MKARMLWQVLDQSAERRLPSCGSTFRGYITPSPGKPM